MEIIDRYTNEVGILLPRKKRADMKLKSIDFGRHAGRTIFL